MRLICNLTISVLLSTSTLVYSQKLGKFDEITDQDFTISNSHAPTVISCRSVVTFPYRQDNANAGAKDEYFTVRVESIVRIMLHKDDSDLKFLGLSKTFENGIKINSVKYYYKNRNTIETRKIKESGVLISSDDMGYYIDYSQIVQDSSVIIDINFRSDSKSKQNLQFYLDKNKTYRDYLIQIYIPEIYFYNIFTSDQCIKTELKKDLPGPMIGYKPATGPYKQLESQLLVDYFKKEFNSKYEQVYCKNNLFTFSMINSCLEWMEKPTKEIISLKLNNILEIK